MAIINKDFRLKNGLVVEGTNATVNGNQILTETASDQYIIDLIGGETLVTSVESTQMEVIAGELNIKSGVFDADGSADTAEQNAKNYADGLAVNYDAAGSATTAENNAKSYADGVALTAENNAKNYADGLASNYDPAGSASSAQTAAQSYADGLAVNYDAAGAASTAESNANSYTNQEITTALSTAQGYANTAESNANSYTDGEITTALSTAQGYADQAESNANAYTDNAVSGLAWKSAVNLKVDSNINVAGNQVGAVFDGHAALTTADAGYRFLLVGQTTATENGLWESFADGAALYFRRPADGDTNDELIGAAVYVQEGTQYGSTSWVQANHYITAFAGQNWTQFSGQGSVTAGSGITVDGLEVSVNRTTVDTWYDAAGSAADAETAANSYTDGEITTALSTAQGYADTAEADAKSYADSLAPNYDSAGSATTAENNAKAYADGLAVNYDAAGAASTAEANAATYTDNAINALDTDDIEEGVNNLYYTDNRVDNEIVNFLTSNSVVTENIQIQQLMGQLHITAENGVADSTTDDLAEGETNLYFTDSRAVSAVSGADITPNTVTIDTFRKEEATQQGVANPSTVNVHELTGMYESAKYLVRVVGWDGGVKHSQITEILMTVDGNNNIAMTEYGNVHTSTNPLASFSATMGVNGATLTATTAVAGCEIIAAATMLSWVD
jgi:hypothetical protein